MSKLREQAQREPFGESPWRNDSNVLKSYLAEPKASAGGRSECIVVCTTSRPAPVARPDDPHLRALLGRVTANRS
jgi:hypothetical protein